MVKPLSHVTFVARQKRIIVDNDDFYLDLLFFHRDLRRLVAVELKRDKFRPEHKGQMELYLRWLDRYERKSGENSPLGIILCSGKDNERIELLELGQSGIHVAEYLTALPPKKILHIERLFAVILHRAFSGDQTAKWREAHINELLKEIEKQVKVLEVQS